MPKPSVEELRVYAREQGLEDDIFTRVDLFSGRRVPRDESLIQGWIDRHWGDRGSDGRRDAER